MHLISLLSEEDFKVIISNSVTINTTYYKGTEDYSFFGLNMHLFHECLRFGAHRTIFRTRW